MGERLSDSGEHRTAARAFEDIDRERESGMTEAEKKDVDEVRGTPSFDPDHHARTPFWLWL